MSSPSGLIRALGFGVGVLLAGAADATAADRRLPMGEFVQEIWESREGTLPHPGVTTLMQGRDGYLWIGTYGGVVRFDGVLFQRPLGGKAPGLADHTKCLLEARDGALWIGTRREGAVRLKDGALEVFQEKDGLTDDVRAMAQTKDGTIWFATGDGLVARDEAGSMRRYTAADGLPHGSIWALYAGADGRLWVGTSRFGLARHESGRFTRIPLPQTEGATGPSALETALGSRVLGIVQDRAGALWVGSSVGLTSVVDDRERSFERHPTGVGTLALSRRGGLWGATSVGLLRYDAGAMQRFETTQGLLHDYVFTVLEDAEGSLWVGTRLGLARLRPRIARTYTARDGLTSDAVFCVTEAAGRIWAGHRTGLARLENETWKTFGVADGLPNVFVRALAAAPDGTLWIGTMDGVASYKDDRFTRYPQPEKPYALRSLAVDARGRVWIGATNGLDVLENGVIRRVLAIDDAPCRVEFFSHIQPAEDGTLWVATQGGGLIHWQPDRVDCVRDEQVLARNDIRALSNAAAGGLWIGSIGGLARWKNGVREDLKGGVGPFEATVYGALEDGRGSLWCTTPRGLFQIGLANIDRYADPEAAPFLYRAFGTGDGMETAVGAGDGQPNSWRASDGRLWITTVAGLTMVDPARMEANDAAPPVYVESLAANRQPVDLRGTRRLAAGTRDVELHFTAVSFVAPERVACRYKLEGFDAGWVNAGTRRVAYYTNLPPRGYRFRVIAANANGVWNEAGASLEFEVQPYFYQTRWFAPACLLLGLALGTAAYRVRMARVRANEIELQRRVEQAMAQIKTLRGLLPVCASCKKIRDDSGYWNQMETYISDHSGADFSHSICPDCLQKLYPDYAAEMAKKATTD